MKNVTVATEVTLTEKQVQTICTAVPGDTSVSSKVSLVAGTLLRDASDGGLMLPREAVDRIQVAINSIDSDRIVEQIEDSVNRKGQQLVLKLVVDPGWEPALREASESQGRPIEDLMQECMSLAFTNGWLYALPAEPPPLTINREDSQFLKDLLGVKTLFGADVMAWIRDLAMPKEEAAHAHV